MTKVVLIKSESNGPDKFVKELQNDNFIIESISSIDFQFKNLNILCDKFENHGDYGGVVFTSPRAVIAAEKAVKRLDKNIFMEWNDKMFNYTVGESTSNLVDKLLGIRTKGKQAGNALNLSTIIANDYSNFDDMKKLLFPCGNLKQDILEKNLQAHSIELDAIEVYETVQHPNLEDAVKQLKDVEFIVFFSPSSVNFSLPFIKKYDLNLKEIKVIAIGPSTQKCLESNEIECDGVCEKPSPENLLLIIKKLNAREFL